MKKSILTLAVFACLAGGLLTRCNTTAQKVENAQNNVDAAESDLYEANQEYLAEIENYRKEAEEKLAANNRSITDFNNRMENEKAEVRADYKRKIAVIEQKNSDLKKKLDDYKAEGKEKWEKFKSEFGRDMDELGQAFKNLTVNN